MMHYHCILQIGRAHPQGASATLISGEMLEVDGEPMIRVGRRIEPADEWFATPSEAYHNAAMRIENFVSELLKRAAEYRILAQRESRQSEEVLS